MRKFFNIFRRNHEQPVSVAPSVKPIDRHQMMENYLRRLIVKIEQGEDFTTSDLASGFVFSKAFFAEFSLSGSLAKQALELCLNASGKRYLENLCFWEGTNPYLKSAVAVATSTVVIANPLHARGQKSFLGNLRLLSKRAQIILEVVLEQLVRFCRERGMTIPIDSLVRAAKLALA